MLVLSRNRNDAIIIGDDIKVTILSVQNGKVQLGIEAPTDVPIHRKEIYDAIKKEEERSSKRRGT